MKQQQTYRLTATALLSALALVLSFLEGCLPPLPVPGARLGLANLAIMYALAELSLPCAAGITAVKAVFALLRGPVACLMSAVGGTAALLAMAVAYRFWHRHISFVGVGVLGAAAHAVGQLAVSFCLLGAAMRYYVPILLLTSVPTGMVTGLILNLTHPYLRRFAE